LAECACFGRFWLRGFLFIDCVTGKTLPVEINGKMFQLQLGVNVFNSVQERLEAEQ